MGHKTTSFDNTSNINIKSLTTYLSELIVLVLLSATAIIELFDRR